MKNVIVKPLITEKCTSLSDGLSKYTFIVNKDANKVEIKNEIEKFYGVNVESVNTINYFGKFRRRYTKAGILSGRSASFKKAIVQLSEGETLDFFSSI